MPCPKKNSPIKRSEEIAKEIKNGKYKYVVMGGFWNYYSSLLDTSIKNPKMFEAFKQGFINAVKVIVDNKATPVIIFDTPSTFDLKKNCGLNRLTFIRCKNAKSKYLKNQSTVNNIIESIKKIYPQTIIINPNKIICDDSFCYTSIDGIPFYYSDGTNSHLNYYGSKLIGKLYLKKYGNPLTSIVKQRI